MTNLQYLEVVKSFARESANNGDPMIFSMHLMKLIDAKLQFVAALLNRGRGNFRLLSVKSFSVTQVSLNEQHGTSLCAT